MTASDVPSRADAVPEVDRDKLHAAIRRGLEQGRRGEARPIADALAELRSMK